MTLWHLDPKSPQKTVSFSPCSYFLSLRKNNSWLLAQFQTSKKTKRCGRVGEIGKGGEDRIVSNISRLHCNVSAKRSSCCRRTKT